MVCILYVAIAESNECRRKMWYTYALNRVASVWGEQKDTWHTYAPHENSIRKRSADTEWQKTIMMAVAADQQTVVKNNCIRFFSVFCPSLSPSLPLPLSLCIWYQFSSGILFFGSTVRSRVLFIIWLAHFDRLYCRLWCIRHSLHNASIHVHFYSIFSTHLN